MQHLPFITIGIVALNRAWIIDRLFSSIQSQKYPHDRLFVLFVDGKSKDGTAEIAEQRLSKSDFDGYEIVVQKCSIPEGRNICLKKMQGDLLLFWDSDVIMPPDAVSRLVEGLESEQADLVSSGVKQITIGSTNEIDGELQQLIREQREAPCVDVKAMGMGQSLLSKRLTNSISFDEDLTIHEDTDFCLRARGKGFKLMLMPSLVALDVNKTKMAHSDIYIDMSLRDAMRAIRKKSRVQVRSQDFSSGWKSVVKFFLQHKRYIFYLLYVPAIFISVYGILGGNVFLWLCFPVYAFLFACVQIRRRGVAKGLRAFMLSILVGIPNAFWVAVYCVKYGPRAR